MPSRAQNRLSALFAKIISSLRTLARVTYVCLLSWSGSLRRAKRGLLKQGAIVVLTFHRVLDDDSLQRSNSLPGVTICEGTFRKLAEYLVKHFDLVRFDRAVPGVTSGRLRVAVTFDDGWRDNYTIALPIARSYGLPFAVFICPGLVGQDSPFWPEHVSALLRTQGASPAVIEQKIEGLKRRSAADRDVYLETLRKSVDQDCHSASEIDQLLSWQEINEMRAAGVNFGSHTQTHQILTTVPAATGVKELVESKSAIETESGQPCLTFAYPNGDCSAETKLWVADAGYELAVTTSEGAWTTGCDPLSVPRLNVSEDNVTGLSGRFSSHMFEYTTLWRAWRALAKLKTLQATSCSLDSGEPYAVRREPKSSEALHPVSINRAQS